MEDNNPQIPVLAYIKPESAWHTAEWNPAHGRWYVNLKEGRALAAYEPEEVTAWIPSPQKPVTS